MAAKKRKRTTKKKSGHGLGLIVAGAAVAASAGAYYLYGPNSKQHRRKVKGWVLKASGEVLEQVERAREIDRAKYEKMVAAVADKYKKVKHIDNKDIEKLKRDLKAQWAHIEREAKAGASKGGRKAGAAAKKKIHKVAVRVAKKTAAKRKTKK